eukprot:11087154-Heterocapsa_arctica.AAC.1
MATASDVLPGKVFLRVLAGARFSCGQLLANYEPRFEGAYGRPGRDPLQETPQEPRILFLP